MTAGQRFGRLTAVRFVRRRYFPSGKSMAVWEFQCDCGKATHALANNVRRLHTTSCGCYLNQRRIEVHTKHGDAKNGLPHPIYTVWCGIKQRCEDVNCRLYPRWGGRGIKVLWSSYEDFKRDMETTYQPGLQIERIDNNGQYCKENCKWATPTEQANNRRSNVVLEFNGQKMAATLWARKLGIEPAMLRARLKNGWSIQKALTTPKVGPMMIAFRGEILPLRTWANQFNLDYRLIWKRIKSGWNVELALTSGRYGHKARVYGNVLRQP